MSEVKGSLSATLRALRLERNLSQRKLADALGLSNSVVAMYETGKRVPSFDVLCAYSAYFGKTVAEIVRTNAETEATEKPAISDEDIRFALSNGDKPITDAQYEEVKKFVDFIRSRDKR